jgi:UDP-2,3-diacylglucosamine hydrolase
LSSASPKLGIVAGGGSGPAQLIEACQKAGRDFFVICLEGQAEKGFAENLPHIWLPLGAGAKFKAVASQEKIGEIVMVGRVRRPSIFELRPDWLAFKVVMKAGINVAGDDGLLRGIGKALEEETGARVIGAHEVFGELLTPFGQLGRVAPDDSAKQDILRGIEAARALGRADVGQSAVVQQGIVLGLEDADGTDALIARCGAMKREGPAPILVKTAKPQQDNRFDLPAIGPETVTAAVKAGLRGIAIEAGRSLFLDREKAIALADDAGIFIIGEKING